MASRTSGLSVTIAGDAKGLKRAVADADKSLGRLSKSADDTEKKSKKSFGGIGSVAKVGFGAVAAGAAVGGTAMLGFAKVSVDAAKDVAESITKNQVLFGKYAKSVEDFANSSAKAFGISKRAALEYTGVFGNLSRAIGISKKDSAEMSVRLTKLAADLASFNNTSITDALEALQSGLVGETEPLRKFGVTLSANAVAAEAMRAGIVKTSHSSYEYRVALLAVERAEKAKGAAIKKSGKDSLEARGAALALEKANKDLTKAAAGGKVELNAQQKALASVALITRQTKNAQGDFARTSSGAANQQRILTARIEDLKVKVGTALLPYMTKAITAINKFANQMQDGTGAGGRFAATVKGLVGALKPYINITQDVVGWVKRHKTVMDALSKAIPNPVENMKILTKILDGVRTAAQGVVKAVKAVGDAFKWAGNAAKDAGGFLKGAAGALSPIGDGLGKAASNMKLPAFGGGLHGADPRMAPFASAASRFGLGISSGKNDHSKMTAAGFPSYHGSGEALDFSNGYETPQEMAFARYMVATQGSRLAELIYTPLGFSIKDGKKVPPIAASAHHDHVHLAYDLGPPGVGAGDGIGQIKSLWTRAGGSAGAQNMAAAIAMAESGGDPNVVSPPNSDGSVDRGLWQINSIHGPLSTTNRLGNAKAAVSISSNGRNWNPWTVFKTGAYKRFLGASSGTGADGGSKSKPKTYKKNQTASGGALGGYDPSVVYATENDAVSVDPFTGMPTGAAGFAQRQAGGPLGRPLKGGGPTKGFPAGYVPPETAAFVSPFAGELRQLGAAGALAALTPDLGDDIGVAQRVQDIRGGELDLAKQSGDPDRIREAAEAFKTAIDGLSGLKEALAANTEAVEAERKAIEEQRKSFEALIAADYRSQFNVSQSQYSILAQALSDVVNGGIGQRLGLSLSGLRAAPGAVART